MIDYKTLHPSVQKHVEQTLKLTSYDIGHITPNTESVVRKMMEFVDRIDNPQEVIAAFAFVLGSIWATWEGSTTDFEVDHQMMLTMNDRRVMFDALCEVTYRELMEFKDHPDCPKERVM